MARTYQVNWTDLVSVIGHAIWWTYKMKKPFIVYERPIGGVYCMHYAASPDQLEELGYTIKATTYLRAD